MRKNLRYEQSDRPAQPSCARHQSGRKTPYRRQRPAETNPSELSAVSPRVQDARDPRLRILAPVRPGEVATSSRTPRSLHMRTCQRVKTDVQLCCSAAATSGPVQPTVATQVLTKRAEFAKYFS